MEADFGERIVRKAKGDGCGSEDNRITVRTVEISKEILRKGNLLRIPTVGSSMHPVSRSGDIITVRPTRVGGISAGDVIVYKAGRRMVAHRLVSKRKENNRVVLICQGDTFMRPDPPIQADQVLGKVVAVSRNGRTVRLDTAKSRLIGFFLTTTSPIRPWLYPILTKVRRRSGRLFTKFSPKLSNHLD